MKLLITISLFFLTLSIASAEIKQDAGKDSFWKILANHIESYKKNWDTVDLCRLEKSEKIIAGSKHLFFRKVGSFGKQKDNNDDIFYMPEIVYKEFVGEYFFVLSRETIVGNERVADRGCIPLRHIFDPMMSQKEVSPEKGNE